jgi:hypothetical protein
MDAFLATKTNVKICFTCRTCSYICIDQNGNPFHTGAFEQQKLLRSMGIFLQLADGGGFIPRLSHNSTSSPSLYRDAQREKAIEGYGAQDPR